LKFADLVIADEQITDLAAEVVAVARSSRSCDILNCINPHSFVMAQKDTNFAQALKCSSWLIPDGIGVVLASRFFTKRLQKRVTGPDIFHEIMVRLDSIGGSVIFFGSSESNLKAIEAMVARDYSAITVLATISPPFVDELDEEQNECAVDQINRLSPDLLWVGMTAPKQEKWTFRNRSRLEVGVAADVGAVFDFASGNIPRAPTIFRRYGLEWLFRFLKDPLRLARRTFVSAPMFLLLITLEKLAATSRVLRFKD
jgi:N-acetylglucosaminyldiphosphoundecaprenol N-acetyl-beta-D-mannosaminyltransferase